MGERQIYLRSTDIESSNWVRLLWSFTDEMLYLMSRGEPITIIDKSIKQHGKIERIFIPVMNDLLNLIYFDQEPQNKRVLSSFELAFEALKSDNLLKTKYLYWKGKIKKVELYGITIRVDREPNPLERKD